MALITSRFINTKLLDKVVTLVNLIGKNCSHFEGHLGRIRVVEDAGGAHVENTDSKYRLMN